MSSKIIGHDPFLGTTTIMHPDADGSQFTIETQQDVTDLIDTNKRLYNDFDERARFGKEEFTRVASIPMNVAMDLKRRGILDDPKRFRAFLNDPDNRAFLVRPVRV